MKPILIIFLCAVLLAGAAIAYNKLSRKDAPKNLATTAVQPDAYTKTSFGKKGYDFTVYNTLGKEVRLSDYRGKKVVVVFWASWCGPCKAELPHVEAAYKQYGSQVEFLLVNLTGGGNDTKSNAQKVISNNGYTAPVAFDLDGNASSIMGIRSIPTSYFFNTDGSVVSYQVGSMSQEQITSNIEKLIKA